MFLKFGLINKKSLHTLPLRSVPFHISPSLSLPLQTLRLVSLVSLITKTKRIADRSATNCDTHTPSHTDRQSTLDKYMINIIYLSDGCAVIKVQSDLPAFILSGASTVQGN